MADVENLSTLGVTIDGAQAEASAQRIGNAMVDMGVKGEASAASMATAGQKVTASLEKQYASLQEAQAAWIAEANAIKTTVAATEISTREFQSSTAAYAAMTAEMKAAAPALVTASAATTAVGIASTTAAIPLGRLRQSFSSLAAQATGTSPVIDRILTTFGAMGAGNGPVIAAIAVIAGIGFAMRALSADSRKLAEDANKAAEELAKLREQKILGSSERLFEGLFGDPTKDPTGGGGLNTKIANDKEKITKLQNALLEGGSEGLGGALLQKHLIEAQNQLAQDQRLFDESFKALKENEQKHTAALEETQARELADLIKHNTATADQRALALSIYRQDLDKLAALQKEHPATVEGQRKQLTAESNLQRPIDALQAALYPTKGAAQVAHADDTVTRFTDELALMKQKADDFGKDDAVDRWTTSFIQKIDLAETAAKRLHNATGNKEVADLERVKAGVPDVVADLKQHNQQEFNNALDAQILKMKDATGAQRELNIAQQQSADAVDRVMIAQAGARAVEEAQALATRKHAQLTKDYTDALRAAAEAEEASKINKDPQRDRIAAARLLISQTEEALGSKTGDPAQELKDINDMIFQLTDHQMVLNETTRDYKELEAEINALIRERNKIMKEGASEEKAAMKEIVSAFHSLGDIANVTGNSGLGNILNTVGNVASNIGAAKDAAATALKNDPNSPLGGFASLAAITPDLAAITSVVALTSEIFGKSTVQTEWKQVMDQNNAALNNVALKLEGFQVNAGNTTDAAAAIRAFESDSAAVRQLKDNVTQKGGLFSGHFSDTAGGDLQSQINALGPYLNQIFGPTSSMSQMDDEWRKLVAIAQQYGVTLTDAQGRIIPSQLAKLGTALDSAAQSAFALSDSFTSHISVLNLQNEVANRTQPLNQLQAATQAFTQTAGGLGEPTASVATAAGQAAWRNFFKSLVSEEAAGTLDASKLGGFQNLGDLNSAIQAVLGPLNSMADAANAVTDALTNVPTGFKVQEYQFAASLAGNPALLGNPLGGIPVSSIGLPALPNHLQRELTPATSSSSTVQPPANVTWSGNINITSSATTAPNLLADVTRQFQELVLRGGTNPLSVLLKQR